MEDYTKMKDRIGIKYQEIKGELARRIRKGTISMLEEFSNRYACYNCLESIDGRAHVLIDRKRMVTSLYFLHPICYEQLKSLDYSKDSVFSLN